MDFQVKKIVKIMGYFIILFFLLVSTSIYADEQKGYEIIYKTVEYTEEGGILLKSEAIFNVKIEILEKVFSDMITDKEFFNKLMYKENTSITLIGPDKYETEGYHDMPFLGRFRCKTEVNIEKDDKGVHTVSTKSKICLLHPWTLRIRLSAGEDGESSRVYFENFYRSRHVRLKGVKIVIPKFIMKYFMGNIAQNALDEAVKRIEELDD